MASTCIELRKYQAFLKTLLRDPHLDKLDRKDVTPRLKIIDAECIGDIHYEQIMKNILEKNDRKLVKLP